MEEREGGRGRGKKERREGSAHGMGKPPAGGIVPRLLPSRQYTLVAWSGVVAVVNFGFFFSIEFLFPLPPAFLSYN